MKTVGEKRCSLSKQVADKLEKMIESGEYKVGEKIQSEPELMAIFNVSRNTLREAIHSLDSAGVLEVRQGDGTYVRSNNRFIGTMKNEYDKVNIEDVKEARNALEITIANLAAKRRTDEDIINIEKALENKKKCHKTLEEDIESDMEYHLKIAESCHNQILINLYLSIFDYLGNLISEKQKKTNLDSKKIDELHEKLFEAIKKSDSSKAGVCVQNILNI